MPLNVITIMISTREMALFLRQFATLSAAGIPIIQCCDITYRTQSNPLLRHIIHSVKQQLLSGKSLYDSLKKHTQYFDGLTLHLIHLGEKTGKLDNILLTVAAYHETELKIKSRIKQALFYPSLVLITAMVVTLAMLLFIIPHFAALFQEQHVALPALTASIFFLSAELRHHGWVILLVLVILLFSAPFNFTPHTSTVLRHLPIISNLLQRIELTRFVRQFALSLTSGITLLDTLDLCLRKDAPHDLAKAITSTKRCLHSGVSLYHAMRLTRFFPDPLLELINIGEESGTLDNMLCKAADLLEIETDQSIERLSKLAEPLIMLILGVVIGGIVIGMYLPIFNLGNAL